MGALRNVLGAFGRFGRVGLRWECFRRVWRHVWERFRSVWMVPGTSGSVLERLEVVWKRLNAFRALWGNVSERLAG